MALPASDTFTYTAANVTSINASWTSFGDANVAANGSEALANSTGSARIRWNADTFSNDQYSDVVISSMNSTAMADGSMGPIVRASGTSGAPTMYFMRIAANAYRLTKYVTGTSSSLITTGASSSPWANGDTARLVVQGTTLSLYRKPSGSGDFTLLEQSTDSAIASGAAGLAFIYFGTPAKAASWEGGDYVGASVAITSVDTTLYDGQTGVTIVGTGFGASETGSAAVIISPTDNVANGSAVTQDATSWSDTSVTFTVSRGSLAYGTNMYLFVKESGGTSNASGAVVQFVLNPINLIRRWV